MGAVPLMALKASTIVLNLMRASHLHIFCEERSDPADLVEGKSA